MKLVNYVSEYLEDDLLVLSSLGRESIIIFLSTECKILKLVDEENDLDVLIKSPNKS